MPTLSWMGLGIERNGSSTSTRGRRASRSAVFLVSVAVGAVLGASACGGGGLPTNNGVYWDCTAAVVLPGLDDLPDMFWKVHTDRVCANPTCGASCDQNAYVLRVIEQCEAQCEDKNRRHGIFVSSDFPFVSYSQKMNCENGQVSAGSETCPASIRPGGGGPAMFESTLDPTQSAASITVAGTESATTSVSGTVRFSIGKSCEGPCPFDLVDLRLTASPFALAGATVSGIAVSNLDNAETTISTYGDLVFPAGSLLSTANFDFDGQHGGVGIANQTPLVGFFNQSGEGAGAFGLQGTFLGEGSRMDFNLQSAATTFPPEAVLLASSQVECNQPNAGSLQLDGRASRADSPIVRSVWISPPNRFLGEGLLVNATLPLGDNFVELLILDSNGVTDAGFLPVRVADTRPPLLQPPPDITIFECTSANIGMATATDACGGAVTVTNNAPSRFAPGTTIVTWTAVDARGNVAAATQRVTFVLGNNPVCCPAGSNIIIGTSNNDNLSGTNGSDCILGRGGQDIIKGLGGNDVISGGDGDDRIDGGPGNDSVFGGSGQDDIVGGSGDDTLLGNDGDDRMNAGLGNDRLHGGQGQDRLNGQDGNDALFGDDGDDTLDGGNGNDDLVGGANNDSCTGGPGVNSFAGCEFGMP